MVWQTVLAAFPSGDSGHGRRGYTAAGYASDRVRGSPLCGGFWNRLPARTGERLDAKTKGSERLLKPLQRHHLGVRPDFGISRRAPRVDDHPAGDTEQPADQRSRFGYREGQALSRFRDPKAFHVEGLWKNTILIVHGGEGSECGEAIRQLGRLDFSNSWALQARGGAGARDPPCSPGHWAPLDELPDDAGNLAARM